MLPAAGFIPGVRPQFYSVNVGIKIKFVFKTKEGLGNIQVGVTFIYWKNGGKSVKLIR